MSERPSGEQVVVYEVEVPAIYTADLEDLREYKDHFDSESDWLLNCLGEPGICRLRVEISGEKDSEVVEVWGQIRGARLAEPGRGYGDGSRRLTDDQLAESGGFKLMRDEDSCEWCAYEDWRESDRERGSA